MQARESDGVGPGRPSLRALAQEPSAHCTPVSGRRIVVAGGAGFIASHLCDRLIERGDDVIAVDNLLTGSRQNLSQLVGHGRFTFLEQDVCEPFAVDGRVDAVLDLARPASPKDFATIPLEILAVGSIGTRQLLELARAK